MNAKWGSQFFLSVMESKPESIPAEPGIYVIGREKVTLRIAGVDPNGILYIGQSINLRNRLELFINADHLASDLLYWDVKLASIVLDCKCRDKEEVLEQFVKLSARIATPISADKLEEAERAVMYAYVESFGELPPLNFNMPDKRGARLSEEDLKWARQGLE
jgi:hypothetical protein